MDDLVLPNLLGLLQQRRMDEFEDNSKVGMLRHEDSQGCAERKQKDLFEYNE